LIADTKIEKLGNRNGRRRRRRRRRIIIK